MQKIDVFDIFSGGIIHTWKQQLLQGLLFILFGLALIFFPQLLTAMIASLFIVVGLLLVGSAHSLRRFSREYHRFRNEIFNLF